MKFLKWTGLTLILIVVIGAVMHKQIILHAPGIINKLKHPVAEHKEIQWTPQPADLAVIPSNQRKPNIILIIADDLGWNDISLNGGGVDNGALQTPNINELAQNGVNFTQGYTADGTCAPSRAAIMISPRADALDAWSQIIGAPPSRRGQAKLIGLVPYRRLVPPAGATKARELTKLMASKPCSARGSTSGHSAAK